MQSKIKTELIKNFLRNNHITKTEFCKMCKINYRTLNSILNNARNFRLTAIFKIANTLGINAYEMFE